VEEAKPVRVRVRPFVALRDWQRARHQFPFTSLVLVPRHRPLSSARFATVAWSADKLHPVNNNALNIQVMHSFLHYLQRLLNYVYGYRNTMRLASTEALHVGLDNQVLNGQAGNQ
jgi:hypothetical protein